MGSHGTPCPLELPALSPGTTTRRRPRSESSEVRPTQPEVSRLLLESRRAWACVCTSLCLSSFSKIENAVCRLHRTTQKGLSTQPGARKLRSKRQLSTSSSPPPTSPALVHRAGLFLPSSQALPRRPPAVPLEKHDKLAAWALDRPPFASTHFQIFKSAAASLAWEAGPRGDTTLLLETTESSLFKRPLQASRIRTSPAASPARCLPVPAKQASFVVLATGQKAQGHLLTFAQSIFFSFNIQIQLMIPLATWKTASTPTPTHSCLFSRKHCASTQSTLPLTSPDAYVPSGLSIHITSSEKLSLIRQGAPAECRHRPCQNNYHSVLILV